MGRPSVRPLRLLAFLAFVSLGLPDGILGVAWPSMRASLGVPLSHLGLLLAAAMAGYLLSTSASGVLAGRLGVGGLLWVSSTVMVASALGYALSGAFPATLGAGLLGGLGAGAIDAGINAYAALHFSPRLLNWLHASYGLGAMLGPLVMTAALAGGLGWRWGYGLIGLALLPLAVAFALTRTRWVPGPAAPLPAAPSTDVTPRGPVVWLGLLFFFLYTGLEVTAGQWSYSLLTDGRGMAPVAAGVWVSVFWGSLAAGRVVFGALAARRAPAALLRLAVRLAALPAAVLWLDLGGVTSGLALAVLGFVLAPVYPLAVAVTPSRVGVAFAPRVIGLQVAAAYLGTAALPGLAGVLARMTGLEAIAALLLAAALALAALERALAGSMAGAGSTAASR